MTRKSLIAILCSLAILICLAPPVYASDYHEDPNAAKQIFSDLSLLLYYSGSLDPVATETALNKMPFANIPQGLAEPADDFSSSGIALSHSIADLFKIWQQENGLIGQYRLDEAAKLGQQISDGLPQARDYLAKLKLAAENTGSYMKIETVSQKSELRNTYDQVMEKIDRLGKMLDLLSRPLLNPDTLAALVNSADPGILAQLLGIPPDQAPDLLKPENAAKLQELLGLADPGILAQLLGIPPDQVPDLLKPENAAKLQELLGLADPDLLQKAFKSTILTLEIIPLTAFVGDEVNFTGVLSSQGEPLGNRDIDILLNSSQYLTVRTDAQGRYQGKLQVPYWYIPALEVQTLYYPREQDLGLYLGSASPAIMLNVQYYEAKLVIQVNGPAYPGREAAITGNFDYGQAAPIDRPQSELYLDNTPIIQFIAPKSFTRQIQIDPAIELDKHTVTLSVPADGRYAPVNASCVMEVIQAVTVLDFNAPKLAFIPGSLGLGGKLHSELGPLQDAAISVGINKNKVNLASSLDGSFKAQVNMGMGLNLFGSQTVIIQVQPREPWNAPLSFTGSIFIINAVNCGILLALLLVLTIYLPRRFKKGYGAYPGKTAPPVEALVSVPAPVYQETVNATAPIEENFSANDDLPKSIFNGYRLVIKLVQVITRAVLKPQQTLREYAGENRQALGPLSQYFLEFTFMIERLLYSTHQPTKEDVERSRQLSQSIKGEAKGENV